MGKATKARRKLTLWKWRKKWNGIRGWDFVSCTLVQPYYGPMLARPLGGIVEKMKKAFGLSKHRKARQLRFRSRNR